MTDSTALRPSSPRAVPDQLDRLTGWGRVARASGWSAGIALLTSTLLYLLDATDVLAPSPVFHRTAAGVQADVARWYVAFFHRQHDILWSVVVRDLLGPAGFVALTVLAVAAVRLTGWAHPRAVLAALFLAVGAVLHIVSDLLYLGEISYWRQTGWSADPAVPMVVIGRASEALDHATTYIEAGSYLVLAAALCCLAGLCRSDARLPSWLGTLALVEALGLVTLFVGIALQQDAVFEVAGAATGIVLGPLFAVALGRRVGAALAADPAPDRGVRDRA